MTHYQCWVFTFETIYLRLYKERLSQVDLKLQEVMAGNAPEYLEPLATLQENMQIRTKVAGRFNRSSKLYIVNSNYHLRK